MEEYEVIMQSSASQFNEFLEGSVWTDIKSELNVWLEGVRNGLENPETDEKELYRNQGRAEAVRYVLSLPETIRDAIAEVQQKHTEEIKDEEEK